MPWIGLRREEGQSQGSPCLIPKAMCTPLPSLSWMPWVCHPLCSDTGCPCPPSSLLYWLALGPQRPPPVFRPPTALQDVFEYFVKYTNTKTWATKEMREIVHISKDFTTMVLWKVTLWGFEDDVIYKMRVKFSGATSICVSRG